MKINIPRSAVLTLIDVLEKILFKLAENNGDNKTVPVERSLPFGLKYKLVSNYNSLVTAASDYDTKRKEIIKKYGVENEETHEYSIQDFRNTKKPIFLSDSSIILLKIQRKFYWMTPLNIKTEKTKITSRKDKDYKQKKSRRKN